MPGRSHDCDASPFDSSTVELNDVGHAVDCGCPECMPELYCAPEGGDVLVRGPASVPSWSSVMAGAIVVFPKAARS